MKLNVFKKLVSKYKKAKKRQQNKSKAINFKKAT